MRKLLIATLLALLASSFTLSQTSSAEPAKPTQSQLEAEIIAASHKLDEAFMTADAFANRSFRGGHRPPVRGGMKPFNINNHA